MRKRSNSFSCFANQMGQGKSASHENIAADTESAKKQFSGHEIQGKTLGIIGLGAIGGIVANAAVALGMKVYGYDPFMSVQAAWNLSPMVHHAESEAEVYAVSDYLTIHVPATDSTKGMINRETIKKLKRGAVVLNFARDVLVDEKAMTEALIEGQVSRYVTDFPNTVSANMDKAIVIPHLGASTEEAEDN